MNGLFRKQRSNAATKKRWQMKYEEKLLKPKLSRY